MRAAARILGVFFLLLFLLFTAKFTFAQNTQGFQNSSTSQYLNLNTNPGVPNDLHTLTQNLLIETMSAIGCQLVGIDPISKSTKCLGINPNTNKIGYVESNGGAIGFMGKMISVLYTPPIHTSDYVKYLSSNFGIAKGAYAQQTGVGFNSLSPLVGVWTIFRNIVYLLFVIIFVVIGLGIMLRTRIDARTVMTVQNQIPKIVIALILVTLSLAIAGLLIDLMWLVIIVTVNVLMSADPQLATAITGSSYVTPFSMSNAVKGFLDIASNVAGLVGSTIYNTFNADSISGIITLPSAPEQQCGFLDIGCLINNLSFENLISSTIGGLINAVVGAILGIVVGLFVFFVVIIAIIYSLFKLWFVLLKAYVTILIDIIFAPFWIIAGLVPGAGERVGFGSWIRDLAGNLAAFPVTIALFMIARILMDGINTSSSNFFVPPLIGDPTGATFGYIIAFGIILALPNVVKITRAAFRSPGGVGVGEGFGIGQAVVGGAIGGAIGRTFKSHVNPASGERVAVGAGAKFIDQKVNLRIARTILGYKAKTPKEVAERGGRPPDIKK